jgi:predicted transposase/invertase (TIGR01784 family)
MVGATTERRINTVIITIDPKIDYAFKFLLGNEANVSILIALLNAILKLAVPIVHAEILNPFTQPMAIDEKLCILDVRARDQIGRIFNIEMQMSATPSLQQRLLYYSSKVYTDQLPRGTDYELLKPTICICFLNGVLYSKVPGYHLEFQLVDTEAGVKLTDDLTIHLIELPKFRLSAEDITTAEDAWIYFLKNAERMDHEALPGPLNTAEMRRAGEALMTLTEIDTHKHFYEDRIKAMRDERMWRLDGLREGREAGREEGQREGREEGQRELLLLLLRERFGELPAELEARVKSATAANCTEMVGRVARAASLDDLA